MELDFEEDFYNATHTNYSGSIKVTRHLSDIFARRYDTPSHKWDEDYDSWEKSYRQLMEQFT